MSAARLEGAVLDRLRTLVADPATLASETNRWLARNLPKLRKQREALVKQLPEVAADADRMLTEWSAVPGSGVRQRPYRGACSAPRRPQQRHRRPGRQITEIEAATATSATVCEAPRRVDEVYDHLKPRGRKELFKRPVRSADVGEQQITLEIHAGVPSDKESAGVPTKDRATEAEVWLPDVDSNHEPTG